MAKLAIIVPLPFTATLDGVAAPSLASPEPKEVTQAAGTGLDVRIDLGRAVPLDTVLLGFTNLGAADAVRLTGGGDPLATAIDVPLVAAPSRRAPATRHCLAILPAVATVRYLRLSGATSVAAQIGLVAVGRAFRPAWNHELGSGRSVSDTGTRTRLLGGGFGVDEGVAVTGWQWTLGDLDDGEVDHLYEIVRDRRQTRPVLVVEDPAITPGLNERVHWSTFDRLETYERRDTGKTKWAFRIEDW